MRTLPKQYLQGSKKSQFVLGLILFICLLAIGFVLWWFFRNTNTNDNLEPGNTEVKVSENQGDKAETTQEPKVLFDAVALQNSVDNWVSTVSSEDLASVVITDIDGNVLAQSNPDESYFAASIYKLYVAYEGYKQVDNKTVDPEEIFLNGQTRAECLDLMIRNSDSPCAEKLWVEIGKEKLTETMKSYGINNTSLVGLTTTAKDAAMITARIARGEELSADSQAKFLTSMKEQIYRDTLNKGFSSSVVVYNKIGFNGLAEYHDVALVEFADGRKLIVSVLTNGVGTKKIVELGVALELAVSVAE